MDLSKLPKLSGDAPTANPAPAQPTPNAQLPTPSPPTPVYYVPTVAPADVAIDLWISLIVGLLLLYMGRNFASYAIATLTGHPFHTNVNWLEGSGHTGEVPYFQLEGYTAWTDTALFLFGLILLLDGALWALAALNPRRARPLLYPAMLLTTVGVLFNLIVCVLLMSISIAPFYSAIAAAIGGWILFDQYRLLGNRTTLPLPV